MNDPTPAQSRLVCRLCGQRHRTVELRPGEKALCIRCGEVLARGSRFGRDGPLAFAITGLILALPASLLPFVTAGRFGEVRQSLLLTGVETLWRNEMLPLSWLVLLCGALLPLGLLGVFAALYAPERFGCKPGGLVSLATVARELEHWAIPEVQVLAVLVALMKLGSLVQVQLGAGFWCYCGMSLALLIAQHSFDRETYGGHAVPAASAPQNP